MACEYHGGFLAQARFLATIRVYTWAGVLEEPSLPLSHFFRCFGLIWFPPGRRSLRIRPFLGAIQFQVRLLLMIYGRSLSSLDIRPMGSPTIVLLSKLCSLLVRWSGAIVRDSLLPSTHDDVDFPLADPLTHIVRTVLHRCDESGVPSISLSIKPC